MSHIEFNKAQIKKNTKVCFNTVLYIYYLSLIFISVTSYIFISRANATAKPGNGPVFPLCGCMPEQTKICASNGKTYDSVCAMQCDYNYVGLYQVGYGPCQQEVLIPEKATVTYSPVMYPTVDQLVPKQVAYPPTYYPYPSQNPPPVYIPPYQPMPQNPPSYPPPPQNLPPVYLPPMYQPIPQYLSPQNLPSQLPQPIPMYPQSSNPKPSPISLLSARQSPPISLL